MPHGGVDQRIKIRNFCPTVIKFWLPMPFSCFNSSTERPYLFEMENKVSPDWTVWIDSFELGLGNSWIGFGLSVAWLALVVGDELVGVGS